MERLLVGATFILGVFIYKKYMNSYELSRAWFDWCFENPEKVSPNHTAIYFFAIEHCNRLGWKNKFGFPTQMAMDALGIKKHQTYIKYFNDLCEWGFFKLVQKSLNQYSANIISLSVAMPKKGKALDKAFITHAAKQTEPNGQSNGSIDKQITINNEPINNKPSLIEIWFKDLENSQALETIAINNKVSKEVVKNKIPEFKKYAELEYGSYANFVSHFKNWFVKNKTTEIQTHTKKINLISYPKP